MSRITNWKLEKPKVKVVYRLQFHASHIPQTGWDKLFVSFFPAESVKLTAKTTKASVRNGTCKWADPIYETTRLVQDSKTKQYDDKFYKFVVAMGSSRASILGEASINLADYADALKPSVVPLPLHGCNSGAILHVTVQLLTSKTGFREFEQQREQREKGFSTGTDQNKNCGSGSGNTFSPEGLSSDQVDVKVRLRSRSKDLPPLEEEARSTDEYLDLSVGFEGSSNTSESLCAEKNETCSTHEIESLKSMASGDLSSLTQCQSPLVNPTDHQTPTKGKNDWIHGWGSDGSIYNDLVLVQEENARLKGNLEVAEASIHELKMQVSSLQVNAHEIGVETQNFAKQLSAELISSEELVLEISAMKSECVKLKDDIEFLRSIKSASQSPSLETSIIDDHMCLVRDVQLKWLERLLFMEGKVREVHNKVYLGFQERDIRFLTSDLESLLVSIQELREGNGETISLLNNLLGKSHVKENSGIRSCGDEQFVLGNGFNVDLYQPTDMLHCLNMPNLKSQEPDSSVATSMLKDKIFELLKEVDDAKAEREALTVKMEQMESYYEALIHNLEENQKQILGELRSLTDEHSTCLFNISSTKTEMESIRQDMNRQILQLAEEKHDLDAMNKEIEKRAVTSEAALRRSRLNYSIAVEQLQKDLDLLSSQVLSMFETNENIIKHTYSGSDVIESFQPQNQNVGLKKQHIGREILVDDMKKSLILQEELYQKVEGELCEIYSMNMHLDVFSKILQQTLVEANAEIMTMGEKTDQLSHELSLSTEANKSLMLKLQAALDDIEALNDCKITNSMQNQLLEDKLGNLSRDNAHLSQKVIEFKSIIQKYTDMESRYEACFADNTKLSDLLKQESSKNEILQNDLFVLTEGLKMVKAEYDELISSSEIVQAKTRLSEDKLRSLLASHSGEFSKNVHDFEQFDIMSIIEELEILLSVSGKKSIELLGEKKLIEEERDIAQTSMGALESEIISLKQKFNHDVHQMDSKIVSSGALLEKLQLQLDVFANRLQISCDAEEAYTNQNRELYANIAAFEAEITQLVSKNSELAKEILALESVNEQVSYSNSTISRLTQENQQLMVSLQEKDEKCAFHREEVQVQRNLRINIEETILGLTSQLNEKNVHLLDYEQLKSELAQLRMDIEGEKNLRNNIEESITDLNCQLKEKNVQLLDYEQLKTELAQLRMDIGVERNLKISIEETVSDLTSQLNEKNGRLLDHEQLKDELSQLRMDIELERNLRNNIEESVSNLTNQLNEKNDQLLGYEQLKAELAQLRVNSEVERNLRATIEETVSNLTSQLNEKNDQLLDNEQLKAEFAQLRMDIEVERNLRYKSFSDLTSQLNEKNDQLLGYEGMKTELDQLRMDTETERSLRDKSVSNLTSQLNEKNDRLLDYEELKAELVQFRKDVEVERNLRDNIEETVSNLTSQLNEKNDRLLDYEQLKAELVQLRKDIEVEKSRVCIALTERDSSYDQLHEKSSSLIGMGSQLSDMHEHAIVLDVKSVFLRSQYEDRFNELSLHTGELQKKNLHLEMMINNCMASQERVEEENAWLVNAMESLRSELKVSHDKCQVVSDLNRVLEIELEKYKKRVVELQAIELEVRKMEKEILSAEEENDHLIASMEESEVFIIVLVAGLNELNARVISLEGYKDKTMKLQNQYDEINTQLSEQTRKAEEFKNLSTRLKELKDEAEAECNRAREKRVSEGQSDSIQESLRIAFMKEQCETIVQELKQELFMSKKHGEEMLLKLQDAVDEIENRKKFEASHSKRSEDLAQKALELEEELQSVVSDNREKNKAYDSVNNELECALLSIEYCKEEKEVLKTSLQECMEENSRISNELTLTNKKLETLTSHTCDCKRHSGSNGVHHTPTHHIDKEEDEELASSIKESAVNYSDRSFSFRNLVDDDSGSIIKVDKDIQSPSIESESCSMPLMEQIIQGTSLLHMEAEKGTSPQKDQMHLALINDTFKNQSLKSSMDNLQKELERMKSDNLFMKNDNELDPDIAYLQKEMAQLDEVNEQLKCKFPSFIDCQSNGNALERVLALEIELAESLQSKQKSNVQFQSSFFKQHNDEQAVLQSFRDINELIKEMLDMKGRYSSVENELNDMHDRYSQLSLQFAEVEGERQKLSMMLKNTRTSKKQLLSPIRSSSVALANSP